MGIRNQNWYNLQSTRRYPLDEVSTGYDDAGQLIRDDILVDCHILFPQTLGACLYVQGITVSAGIVSVVFGVTSIAGALSGEAVAYVSVPQPVRPNINYDIVGLKPGVNGWVTFGNGVDVPFSGRYSTSVQTAVLPRCARAYKPLPVTSLAKQGVADVLDGLIKITGQSPVTATKETITVNNVEYPALVLRLNKQENVDGFNPFSAYLGPCAQRPESGTCGKPGITSINGIEPDCHGNINIAVTGFNESNSDETAPDYELFTDCGGMEIISDENLQDLCTAAKADPPNTFIDKCCVAKYEVADQEGLATIEEVDRFPGLIVLVLDDDGAGTPARYSLGADLITWTKTNTTEDDCAWPNPASIIPDVIIEELPPQAEYPCVTYPVCADFNSCSGETPQFETKSGLFSTQSTIAPPICADSDCGTPAAGFTQHNTYAAVDNSGLNIAIFKNCATDWAIDKTIAVEFKIGASGLERNGGLLLNYLKYSAPTLNGSAIRTTFVAITLDVNRGRLRVLRYTNGLPTVEVEAVMAVRTDSWYRISATPVVNGNYVAISATAENLTDPTQATVSTSVQIAAASYGTLTGQSGLFAGRSNTYFNKFTIEDA